MIITSPLIIYTFYKNNKDLEKREGIVKNSSSCILISYRFLIKTLDSICMLVERLTIQLCGGSIEVQST